MSTTANRVRGLRANSLAAVVMLVIQYSLGITVNLYSTLPAADRGKGLLSAFGAAVGNGPVALTLHALLGTLLLITATAAVIRSVRIRAAAPISLSAVALLAILAAWMAGATFVGRMNNGSSLGMALAAAVALLCYVLLIFILGLQRDVAPRPQTTEVPS